ncbi:methyltransferase family protein [Ruminiclostridium sufflavum DSM 19573]|uniref:Methyltransferase family protein n=1 Tax=Ruminiclostridium sufflavum DSM 19573 TaxID=1121337 RepID=A0A318XHL6_9FIRM|nr:class I SAM-dependent methyltransferase [Ruminiclostridium sufflavum]PYG86690.1 methyltransferase family protein [Ruminiclostridium sufflavum DSM 19573]
MKKIEIIKDYYMQNNQKNKPDYFLLGWESEDAQRQRFEVLVNNLDLHGKKILDIGCGTGNFLQYLEQGFSDFSYTGVDILEHMITKAKAKKLKGTFLCTDIFKENPFSHNEFDVIFASGTFNINLGNNKKFLVDALRLFSYISKEIISFNLLDEKSPNRENNYFYSSPEEICDLINNNFPDFFKIKVIEGYLQNDFTVVCYK